MAEYDLETKDMTVNAESTLALARVIEVTNDSENQEASDMLKSIKRQTKALNDKRLEMTRPLDDSKKRIMGFFKPPTDFLKEAAALLDGAIVRYRQEQNRILREEENRIRKLQEEADKEAEEQGLPAPVIETSMPAPVKATGSHVTTRWKAEVLEPGGLMELVKAIAAGEQSIDCILPNMTYLNQMAVANKGNMSIPGVKAVSKDSISSR